MGHKYVKEDETFNTSRNGTVPKPSQAQVTANKFLRADGSWQDGGSGGASSLDDLSDVDITSPEDGDVLTYDESTSTWKSVEPLINEYALTDLTDISISSPSNGEVLTYDDGQWINANPTGGASDLTDLGDVSISSATNGQVLKYDSTASKWVNAAESGGGGSSTLAGLSDVNVSSVQDSNVLAYDSSTSKWVPAIVSGGSTTLAGLSDVNTSGVSDGDALVYDSTTSKWIPGESGAVDDVKVNGTTVVDENKVAQIKSYKELTQAQYDALPSSKLTDGILYCITDDGMNDGNKFAPVIYSTAEREIGVWIDGKPIYKKTVIIPPIAAGTTNYLLDFNITTVDKIIDIKTIITSNSGDDDFIVPYPLRNNVEEYGVYQQGFNKSTGKLRIDTGTYRAIDSGFSTIYYTKTTDTPGSGKWTSDGVPAVHYSTSEKIIGTWIDGKPLYEKTVTGTTITGGTTFDKAHGISNLNEVVDVIIMCHDSSNGWWRKLNFAYNNGSINNEWFGGFAIDSTNIKFQIGTTFANNLDKYRVTLQYTKTTD